EIIGLFNAVLNEPYFSTVKALEDVEVIEMNINEIEKIDNVSLINKIYDYLLINIERWLNRYYYFLNKENNPYYNSHRNRMSNINIIEMCKIYSKNGFKDAAYKLYKKYAELYPNNDDKIKELNNLFGNIKPIEEAENIEDNIYKYKKGTCIYTELQASDYLYVIKYGQIGVYNIFDNKQVTRRVLSTNDVLNGYSPLSKNKLLLTTAIVLHDSIVELIKKEDAVNLVQSDRNLRLYFVKVMSMRIYGTISRIRAFKANNIVSKFVIIIEALIKNELLFKSVSRISFQYNINDICSMIGIEYRPNIEDDLKKIKALNILDGGYLVVNNVDEFYKEYDIYKQRNSYKIENNN
ncbi:cyclic nucleotide-binding domain-containing protein, partial [Brachyspira murdochii]